MSYPSLFNDDMNIPDVDILRSVPFVFNETQFETRNFNPYEVTTNTVCPFGSTFTEIVSGSTNPKLFLRGGFVFGGVSNLNVEDYELDVNNTNNSGKWLFLKVSFTAVVADDILMPGVESIQSAVFEKHDNPPDNTLPKMLAPNGISYIVMGRFSNGTEPPLTFQPDQCGNVTVGHCPGIVSISRS